MTNKLKSLKKFIAELDINGPNSLDFDSLCSWVESHDWLSMDWKSHVLPSHDPSDYARNILCLHPFEVVLLHWPPGVESAVHLHEGFWGSVVCLEGTLENINYRLNGKELSVEGILQAKPGGMIQEPDGTLHKIRNGSEKEALVTLHFYHPALESLDGLALYDLESGDRFICNEKASTASMKLSDDCYRSKEFNAFFFRPAEPSSHVQCNVVPKPSPRTIEEMVSGYFNEHASIYDEQDAQILKRRQYTEGIDLRVVDCFRELNDKREMKNVLHMACGTGRREVSIKNQVGLDYAMYGIDFSDAMAKQATQRGLKTIVTSLTSIPSDLDLPPFDAITLLYAYGHLPTEAKRLEVLRKAHLMLREGGVFIFDAFDVADENEWGPAAIAQFECQRLGSQGYESGDVFYRRNKGRQQAFLHYSESNALVALVEKAGFTICDLVTIGYDKYSGKKSSNGKLFVVAQR